MGEFHLGLLELWPPSPDHTIILSQDLSRRESDGFDWLAKLINSCWPIEIGRLFTISPDWFWLLCTDYVVNLNISIINISDALVINLRSNHHNNKVPPDVHGIIFSSGTFHQVQLS